MTQVYPNFEMMEEYKNIIITENNYHKYEADLIKLYSASFSQASYLREYTNEEPKKRLKNYLIYKDNLIILRVNSALGDQPISFCVGHNGYCCADKLQKVKERMNLNLKDCYYIAELGTLEKFSGQGHATALLNQLIHSNTDRYSHFLISTNENNQKAIPLYENKFLFKKIDGLRYSVSGRRTDGKEKIDHRIFLYRNITIKKVGYTMLRTAKVEESGEQLVAANHFDKEILLEKATIGLFPYGNGKDYVKVRESVAKKLRDVNQNIMALGKKDKKDYRLNVCYGFRKKDIQKRAFCEQRTKMAEKRMPYDSIYEFVEEIHRFIAVPTVAGHPTGGAVDVTIKDVGNDRFLDMGSLIYEFSSDKVRWDAKGLTLEQKINRQLLFNLITSAGFAPFWGEWWHYSYGDREWAVFYDKPVAIYEQIDL